MPPVQATEIPLWRLHVQSLVSSQHQIYFQQNDCIKRYQSLVDGVCRNNRKAILFLALNQCATSCDTRSLPKVTQHFNFQDKGHFSWRPFHERHQCSYAATESLQPSKLIRTSAHCVTLRNESHRTQCAFNCLQSLGERSLWGKTILRSKSQLWKVMK